MNAHGNITIRGACEHNLKSVDLTIPANQLVVVTGVSGSGKSSLVFDVIYREAEHRYLGSLSSYARQLLGKMKRPEVGKIEGLSPAIAVKQSASQANQRSTMGTITGMWDLLRLLYARCGTANFPLHRSLFSFNSPEGACPRCKGLGVEDHIDPALLISDPLKTLRQGALGITTPNGYIIYSQVTMEVLDKVCRSEGFHTDIPWQELTPEQQKVVLYGSDKIEIPYGKHPLESRMRWSGITAKPRELGHYKGILPVMENILRVDRNRNILRFARTRACPDCLGTRLNEKARSVMIDGYAITALAALQADELRHFFRQWSPSEREKPVATPIIAKMDETLRLVEALGLGYLSLERGSSSLSTGEMQRLRIVSQAMTGLSGLIYIFDEPSIGMHPREIDGLTGVLKTLRDKGNTVIVVEHDEAIIRQADWLIDIGPGPGIHGGELLFSQPFSRIHELAPEIVARSKTLACLKGEHRAEIPVKRRTGNGVLEVHHARVNNLQNIDLFFLLEAINVVTGVSGSGKSTLVKQVLARGVRQWLQGTPPGNEAAFTIVNKEKIGKVIEVDQSPIGRTPRSNPATYTGLFDRIRDLFAAQPKAREMGFDKSRFSFNTPGGRCETCEGAGYILTGMHFMGNVETVCETCEGERFDQETLKVLYRDKNIFDVLEMTVDQALLFFTEEKAILHYLLILEELGLGYLTLGQRSSTLSGGEAQRIKLATELARPQTAHTLYIMDQPTTGLHPADVVVLIKALRELTDKGHTLVCIEHDPDLIRAADHLIELGPGSGREGGRVIAMGPPEALTRETPLQSPPANLSVKGSTLSESLAGKASGIWFTNVTTHNLKNIDVSFPKEQITVITGVSGSGKSSLAFDTLHAEGQNRFLDGFSAWFRSRVGMQEQAAFAETGGLTATFAVGGEVTGTNPRSTVGTSTGIYDLYRLLFARIANKKPASTLTGYHQPESAEEKDGILRIERTCQLPLSSLFSFNHQHGACPACRGLGQQTTCNPERLITHPHLPLMGGAMDGTRSGKFFGDPHGQYIAALLAAGERHGIDFSLPWEALSEPARKIALYGTPGETYSIVWKYKRDNREGEHRFEGPWQGLIALVDEEYKRKQEDHRGESMKYLMKTVPCSLCQGTRLKEEALEWVIDDIGIAELASRTFTRTRSFFHSLEEQLRKTPAEEIAAPLIREIVDRITVLESLGIGYLSPDRAISTLSGGEARRIRLASQLGSGLTGLTYVLDEPSVGLHPRDVARLTEVIRSLKDQGNTVVIVEHDRDVILAADHLIDMGPGAGFNGGRILATGTPSAVMANPDSVTAPWLKQHFPTTIPPKKQLDSGLQITGALAHNLKGFDLTIPAGGIIAITGVSGSGKSTLLFDVILASRENKRPTGCLTIEGFERFSRVLPVNTDSGFSHPTATPASFLGILDTVRNLFAATSGARSAGFDRKYFSFINKEGRCPECQGSGAIRVPMDFLPDVITECEACGGSRFRKEILEIKYHGLSIGDVLQMTCSEARTFFSDQPAVIRVTTLLEEVGLGYLRLGQPLDTLSGGESRRLLLVSRLIRPEKGETLYLFDEPTTGLHFADIAFLLKLFHRLTARGDTLLIIENDPAVLAHADHVIELGPAGGDEGGYLIRNGASFSLNG